MKFSMLIPLMLSALAVASPLASPQVFARNEPVNPTELSQGLSDYRKSLVDGKASVDGTPPNTVEPCVHLECECTGWEESSCYKCSWVPCNSRK